MPSPATASIAGAALAQVDVELARGNLAAASQTLWEAAAHAIKAAATRRHWPHESFADLGDAITRLYDEEGGPIELHWYFVMASSFDRIDTWEIPLHEAGIRYCSKGPIKELLLMLEGMD